MGASATAVNRTVNIGDVQMEYVAVGSGDAIVSIVDRDQPHLHKSDLLLAEKRRLTCFSANAQPDNRAAAKQVIEALKTLNVDRFDLISYGEGATVALDVARSAPGVRSITLISPKAEPHQTSDGVKCPALTLFGTSDENASIEGGRTIELRPSHSHLMYVYEAGSNIGDERPEALAFIIGEFLERSDEFLVSRESGRVFP